MSERNEKKWFENSFFEIQTWERDRRGMPSCRSGNYFIFPTAEQTAFDSEPNDLIDGNRKRVNELEERFKQTILNDGYPFVPD